MNETCKNCRHFHLLPLPEKRVDLPGNFAVANAVELGQPRVGECRESYRLLSSMMMPMGKMVFGMLPDTSPACGRYEEQIGRAQNAHDQTVCSRDNFRSYVDWLIKLRDLAVDGQDETEEAAWIRAKLESYGATFSDEERDKVNEISDILYGTAKSAVRKMRTAKCEDEPCSTR